MVDAGDASCDAIFNLPRRMNLFKAWIANAAEAPFLLSSLFSFASTSTHASFVWSHNANLGALVNHHYCDDHDDHAAKSRRVQLGICRRPPYKAMQCFQRVHVILLLSYRFDLTFQSLTDSLLSCLLISYKVKLNFALRLENTASPCTPIFVALSERIISLAVPPARHKLNLDHHGLPLHRRSE